MKRPLPSPYLEAVEIAQQVHELADYTQQLESLVMQIANAAVHPAPSCERCECAGCELIRKSRRILEARRRKAGE